MRLYVRAICRVLNSKGSRVVSKRLFNTISAQSSPCLQLEWQISKETVFNQQKRDYVPKISYQTCWNCLKELSSTELEMKCSQCGFLQDVKTDVSYFCLLNFPEKFDLDIDTLTKRFRQLQTFVHPDKFSNKSSREQSNSGDWSSLINKAYKTLSTPLSRGQYLLELKGIQMPQDNSALEKEFLMEMMERNEEVEDATTKSELNAINQQLEKELKEKTQILGEKFAKNDLEKARKILIEMKYLISIQKAIKNKLQAMLDI